MKIRCMMVACIAVCTLSVSAHAHTLYGSLVGTVTDESGLAVPGATGL